MPLYINGENETPAYAFIRKMLPREETVIDKQTRANIMSNEVETIFYIPCIHVDLYDAYI